MSVASLRYIKHTIGEEVRLAGGFLYFPNLTKALIQNSSSMFFFI